MDFINNLLKFLFLIMDSNNNSKKNKTIHEFNIYIEKLMKYMDKNKDYDLFSNLTEQDKIMIKKIIFKYGYPRKLKPYAVKLYNYTDIENLLFCAINLCSIELVRGFHCQEIDGAFLVSEGAYYPSLNKIRYHYKSAIPHEFMHMSSKSIIENNGNQKLGFGISQNDKKIFTGLNEGYTEMLARRIYYNENYNGESYTTRVYAMRLLELLYDNKKDMERDYLRADAESLKNHFLKFGTEDEFLYFTGLLDGNEWEIKPEEKIIILNYIKEIVKRTYDSKKIQASEEIEEEFQKIIKK